MPSVAPPACSERWCRRFAGYYLIRSVQNLVEFFFAFGVTTTRPNRPWKEVIAGAVLVFFVAYCAAHVLKVIALERALDVIIGVLVIVLYATLVSLPGIGIAYLTWRLSRNMRPILAQAIFRAGIFAVAITPAFWGHAGFLPAIVLAFVLHGRDRSGVIIEILIVWAIAIPVLFVRARNRRNAAISVN
jgi:hypothetical protein